MASKPKPDIPPTPSASAAGKTEKRDKKATPEKPSAAARRAWTKASIRKMAVLTGPQSSQEQDAAEHKQANTGSRPSQVRRGSVSDEAMAIANLMVGRMADKREENKDTPGYAVRPAPAPQGHCMQHHG